MEATTTTNQGTCECGTPMAVVTTMTREQHMAKHQEPRTTRGVAAELRTGDRLVRIGGKVGGTQFKRYLVEQTVTDAYRTHKQRTRMHLELTQGHYLLRLEYPVEFIPAAEYQASEQAKRDAVEPYDEFAARRAAAKAARA